MNHLQTKNNTVQSPCVLYIFCTLMWFASSREFFKCFFFFFFFFFFSREISWHYIPDKNTVQPTQVFSFARSRFLVFPREMVWLYIRVRLMSNLFSFHSRFLINLNKSKHKRITLLFWFTYYIENLLNFSIPMSPSKHEQNLRRYLDVYVYIFRFVM